MLEKDRKVQKKNIIQYLPYLEYLPDSKLFVLTDKSLGVIYRLETLDHEPMLFEDIANYSSSLQSFLDLPSNCVLQFYSYLGPISEDEISKVGHLPWKPESQTANFLRSKRIEGLNEIAKNGELLKREVYFSIRFVPKKLSRFNIFSKLSDSFLEEIKEHEKKVEDFEKILNKLEAISKINLKRIDSEDLRSCIRRSLFCKKRPLAPMLSSVPLAEQILFSDINCDNEGLCGEIYSKTVSLLAPGEYCQGDAVGFLNLDFPSIVSLRLTTPSKMSIAKTLGIKEWCTKNSFSHRSKKQFEEIQETKKRLAKDDPCLHLSWSVTVFGKTKEEVNHRANYVIGLGVEKFKCNSIFETDCGFDIFWNSLPLNFDPKSEWGIQRFIPRHRSEVSCLLPVFGAGTGSNIPLQLYENREGRIIPFSLLESPTAQHAVFIGDTGSGKSFLVNSCLNGVKSLHTEPIVFVFDYNTSQTMNTRLYGGEISKCSPNKPPVMNIFRGVYDEKKVSVLVDWMCEAARLTSPSFKIESEHKEALNQSIRLAYRKKLDSQNTTFVEGELVNTLLGESVVLNMDDIAVELSYLPGQKGFEKYESVVQGLLLKLRGFYGDGMYAEYFKPKKNYSEFDKKFYVFDFEGIKDDPILLNLTVLSAFEQVRQVKLKPENEERQVFAFLDEIAELGRDCPLMTRYFVGKTETSRKDAFWIWGATNRPDNFFDLEVCKALLELSSHVLVLPMSPKNVDQFSKRSKLMNIADEENVSSLSVKKGEWGEFYYMRTDGREKFIVRNRPTAYEMWQTPSNAEDSRTASKVLSKNKGDAVKALSELVLKNESKIEK